MGRQVINSIKCSKCGHEINIATEDIEWEHLEDRGPVDNDLTIHDYGVFQSVTCPYCKAQQKIVFTARGKDMANLNEMKGISLD